MFFRQFGWDKKVFQFFFLKERSGGYKVFKLLTN